MTVQQQTNYSKLAIVVLSYNGKDLLEKFLPPILDTCPNYGKVYVVDNASTDGTYDFIKERFPAANLIRLQVNKGFTNGYVESLPQIQAEYYVLISSDVEVAPGWVQPIIDLMDSDSNIGICQPKIKSYNQKTHYEYSGAAGAYIDRYGYPFCRGRIFFTVEEDKGQYEDSREVFWCSGACMFIRSEVYHGIGGFDNEYYAHMEDIDLSWRVKNAGMKVMVCPKATVYHVGGHIISYGSPAKVFRNYKNGLIMMVKNMHGGNIWGKILFRILLDNVAAIRAILTGNFKEYNAIFRAHIQFYGGIGHWFKKRREARLKVNNPNKTGVYNNSIVLQYFINRKDTFDKLGW